MSAIQGILLGILQGVAEFLPISSSGHLQIAQQLFGLKDVPLLFDVFLHLATLLAVTIYFWPKIWNLLKVFGRWISLKQIAEENQMSELAERKTIIAIIISTILTGGIGVVTSKLIPAMPTKIVCTGFLVTSILLISSALIEKKRAEKSQLHQASEKSEISEQSKGVSVLQSVVIGIMQGFGTLPGISRSGSTIAGALFSGLDRNTAGDYSFIVSIPAILGAFILEVKDLGEVSSSVGAVPVIAGCIAAFAVGYLSLATLMKLIKKGKLQWFAAYLIPVGILGILFL